ncbi:hypothetical protein NA56DRAFT_700949 [Hyaloscypha hepaticicola]|uniref:DUF6594 domain-containing protein n=1 Tax=Hyaloscypha hepaticicola TaxID=2082293 RepID=A0A2J6QBB5_9HELO|nr:hypothetical protein NA56DRAFT_700949 [Hyaloscypha hepaticicola]
MARLVSGSFESDLELGPSIPIPAGPRRYHNYIEQVSLASQPARLPHYYAVHLLFDPYRETGISTANFNSLRYCDIQRITHKLFHLQHQLETGAVLSEADSEEMNRLLRAQATAIRDYEYMTKHLVPASHHQTQKLRPEANAVFPELSFPRNLTFPVSQRQEDVFGWASGRPARSVSVPVRIIASTILAVCGGALLIVPMVIMTFDTNRTKSIVTISCSVLLFGFFLGAIVRSKSSEIFIATTTYAAVLVVFVGAGNG